MGERALYRNRTILLISFLILSVTYSFFGMPVAQASSTRGEWICDRPELSGVDLHNRVDNLTTNDEASVGIGVEISSYLELNPRVDYKDGVLLKVSTTSNTRKGIEYYHTQYCELRDPFPDYQLMWPTGITEDEQGTWLDIPFEVCFWGGPASYTSQHPSGRYSRVWVSSNGFVSFQDAFNSASPFLGSTNKPNCVIAAYWTDLDPSGGSIRYFSSGSPPDYLFEVVWQNVRNKINGRRETFALVITDAMQYFPRGQTDIKLLYQDVSGQGQVGLEDQEGCRSYRPLQGGALRNQDEVYIRCNRKTPEIREIDIVAQKSDSYARIVMGREEYLKGYNMDWKTQEPDPEDTYSYALMGAGTLLLSYGLFTLNPFCGVLFDVALLAYDNLDNYCNEHWPGRFLQAQDASETQSEAYIKASAESVSGVDWPVDAAFDDNIDWIFLDLDRSVSHSMQLKAVVKYYSYKYAVEKTISTAVSLTMTTDFGDDFGHASPLATGDHRGCLDYSDRVDIFAVFVEEGWKIGLDMQPPNDPYFRANFDLYLYPIGAGDNTPPVASSENSGSAAESILYSPPSPGTYYVKVKHVDWPAGYSGGVYNITFSWKPPGGAGCPYLYVWDGERYSVDNNLMPASELSNGADVQDYYRVEQDLLPFYANSRLQFHSFMISEAEQEHDFFDCIKLFAVDHDKSTNIAVTQEGEILTYNTPSPPNSCFDNNGESRLDRISQVDGDVANPATFYEGFPGDCLTMSFGQVGSQNAKLILRTDQKKTDECIEVQLKDATGTWQTIEVVIPRSFWFTEAVNLSPYLVQGNDLEVRLHWKDHHRIDFVGLDTTPQEAFTVTEASLLSAYHSTCGQVRNKVLLDDGQYAELVPGEKMWLLFALQTPPSGSTRTFIFCSEGHYLPQS